MRSRRLLTVCAAALILTGCGGHGHTKVDSPSRDRYGGLSRHEAVRAGMAELAPHQYRFNPSYFFTAVSNITALRAHDGRSRAWLIGTWNGQADTPACALVRKVKSRVEARDVSCASYPRFVSTPH